MVLCALERDACRHAHRPQVRGGMSAVVQSASPSYCPVFETVLLFLLFCFFLLVLLVERLMTRLDALLENAPNIPLGLMRSVLLDVALRLVYLHNHKPSVINHRNLLTKDVL